MNTLTYRDVLRTYARNLESGAADAGLTPRVRRLATVMLNLASNDGRAVVLYPPTDDTRESAVRHLSAIVWDARPLVDAVSPASADAFSEALELALSIARAV